MSLIDLITEEEIDAITKYRQDYGYSENGNSISNYFAPTEKVLKEWANNKNILYKMFGNKLIIEKKFEYEKSEDELAIEISDFLYASKSKAKEFVSNFRTMIYEAEVFNSYLLSMLDNKNIIDNTYHGKDFKIDFPNGRSYRVSNGCKLSKALGKIANGFGIKGFENFRIAHSQVLNQKKLTGNLVLSIHPIDYMTMSDNDCGWDSCMSWKNEGEYRQGTVEMMNSPLVVVAYLKADKDMKFEGIPWANKKWRQLFVVDDNVIAGIKEYPYYNEKLVKYALNWLKDLAESNLGRKYKEPIPINYGDEEDKITLSNYPEKIDFRFRTDIMYNDFGCTQNGIHYMAISEDVDTSAIEYYNYNPTDKFININYSGCNQCMICGETNVEFSEEGCLACIDCEVVLFCEYCEDSTGELFEVDGVQLCRYCYDNSVVSCEMCNEDKLRDNTIAIFVLPRLTKEEQKNIYGSIFGPNHIPFMDIKNDYNFFSEFNRIEVCSEECLKDFKDKYLIEGVNFYKRDYYEPMYYIYFDELNETGRERFFGDVDSNEEFKESHYISRWGYQTI